MSDMTVGVLVAFYLFLAVRWDLVRRPMPYAVGAGAMGVVMLSGIFRIAGGGAGLAMVFTVFGVLTAFAAGIATCCPIDLPIDPQEPSEDEEDEVEIL